MGVELLGTSRIGVTSAGTIAEELPNQIIRITINYQQIGENRGKQGQRFNTCLRKRN